MSLSVSEVIASLIGRAWVRGFFLVINHPWPLLSKEGECKSTPRRGGGFSGACSAFFYLIRLWWELIAGVLIGGSVLDGLDEGLRDGTDCILGLEVLAQVGMRLTEITGILEHARALQVIETAVFATELASTLVENGADDGS